MKTIITINFNGRTYTTLSKLHREDAATYIKAYDPNTLDEDGFYDAVLIYFNDSMEPYHVDIFAAYNPLIGIC